jgi:hypothetical protein
VVSVATVGSAIAPEQYIATRTAKGFIGNSGSGCWDFVEARERLDFFKILSPSRHREIAIILCRRRASILCKRFLKPVAGLILRL